VTEAFWRIWAGSGKCAEKGTAVSTRRSRPGVGFGARSQKPVGMGGMFFTNKKSTRGQFGFVCSLLTVCFCQAKRGVQFDETRQSLSPNQGWREWVGLWLPT